MHWELEFNPYHIGSSITLDDPRVYTNPSALTLPIVLPLTYGGTPCGVVTGLKRRRENKLVENTFL